MAIDLGDIPSGTEPTTAEKLQIRSAIGVGTTDAPTFGQFITLSDATNFTYVNFGGSNQIQRESSLMWFSSAGSRELGFTVNGPMRLRQGGGISWWDDIRSGTLKASLFSSADNIIEQRNGTNAQAFRVYDTYTDASNYRRLALIGSGAEMRILAQGAGASGAASLNLGSGTSPNWQITTGGNLVAYGDNTYDIGASGANRPRNIYAGSSIRAATSIIVGNCELTTSNLTIASTGVILFGSGTRSKITSPSDGVIRFTDTASTSFSRFELGETNLGISRGTGSPEGVVTALVGSLYIRTDGGASTTLYVKESGTGNTGWVAK